MDGLPPELSGPVLLALARAQEELPRVASLAGGAMYELKWDGFRCAAVRDEAGVKLWSRQRKDLTGHFPEIAAAMSWQVPAGTVLDGELVIWNGDRLDFDLLQTRMVNRPARASSLAAEHGATFMVFDVLAHRGEDLRRRPLRERRAVLEELGATWSPPLQISPLTMDEGTARAWMADYRPAGIEGVVVKAAAGAYVPGRRDWIKVKTRETVEAIIGAVTGPLERPDTVVVGQVRDGVLVIVGKSVPLSPRQAASLAAVLTPAGLDHPWPDEISSTRFGSSRDKVALTKVEPVVVAEVSADAALQAGAFRHPVRFIRHRPDLGPEDLAPD
ncbi:ATP-dependent DNA ligase [Terrabacter sp. MAHUQ-38]|uniref:ATP-dependent DNA ligase n=1 Tax=unclassified Terrabacter TaxID=2630222 RepID=UPI00165DD481|nr:ATP-dependent DNA ligase [Terrabacter sp. MAHUQ-38]MBC9822853.1 ATP-dependent DNA ligase [Terrabacter sp. MAHUQ-38]